MSESLFQTHMSLTETALLHTAQIPSTAGHTLHRGTPRENFIANFLKSHLSDNVAIGTGEIIDSNSMPREPRNQFDIVVYRRNYPKLDFGGVSGFLVESVVATIEVKSVLDVAAVRQAVSAASNLKKLEPNYTRHVSFGWFPPKPLSYVVAYDGPANMSTITGWLDTVRAELNLPEDDWAHQDRLKVSGHALDGISVLGRGAHYLCNTTLFGDQIDPRARSFVWEGERGSLLLFFIALQGACVSMESASLNTKSYLKGAFSGRFIGTTQNS
ncbi:hypothetical protein LGN22_06550 [Burkholderia cenocepacia]|uniref:DUF6602 domain-containing protein n=1 Tax=Burkholderia cenocepacia TaxID=95486 RepID=A0AAW4T8T8_9BURK|nr:DUF6602 domain-containing protein [Burkholderia cenocepacia]MCA8378543.1 hypothetical protein [Burkholderia cenocepacia]